MSTRCIIAVPDDRSSFRGRYAHSDGYPSWTGFHLRKLVNRDGLARVIATLVIDHESGWSQVDSDCSTLPEHSGGEVLVPGYGIAYADHPDQRIWCTPKLNGGAEWAYVLTPDGIVVWQNPVLDPGWRKRPDMDLSLSREQLDELTYQERN